MNNDIYFHRQPKLRNKKSKSKKSSRAIQNQIFLQFFDRNQTSVGINRQPFRVASEIVPQKTFEIDIGKLNWTDASFDRNLKAIDFTKITAEELKTILDEVILRSSCPLGSFYQEEKGCITIEKFGVVPELPNVIEIESLFNRPLGSLEIAGNDRVGTQTMKNGNAYIEVVKEKEGDDKETEGGGEGPEEGDIEVIRENVGEVDIEGSNGESEGSNGESEVSIETPEESNGSFGGSFEITSNREPEGSSIESDSSALSHSVKMGIDPHKLIISAKSGNTGELVLHDLELENLLNQHQIDLQQNLDRLNEFEIAVDEGEIPTIASITKEIDELPSEHLKINMNAENQLTMPSGVLKISDFDGNGKLELSLDAFKKTFLQQMNILNATEDDAIIVEPQIIKETVPVKFMMKLPGQVLGAAKAVKPIKFNLPQQRSQGQVKGSTMVINTPSLTASGKKFGNVVMKLRNEGGRVIDEELVQRFKNIFGTEDDKSTSPESTGDVETTADNVGSTMRQRKQAFLVHEVPLIHTLVARKSASANERDDFEKPETATTAAAPNNSTAFPGLIPAIIKSGKDIGDMKKNILSNFFPRLFTDRRFVASDSTKPKEDIDEIRNNVERPKINYESIEGKTMSDYDTNDTITEGWKTKSTTLASTTKVPEITTIKTETSSATTKDNKTTKTSSAAPTTTKAPASSTTKKP